MKQTHGGVPVIGFVAASGTGKTTLIERLLPALAGHGLAVGCVKHTHHPFEIDHPGKDSHRLRSAGARQVLLGSPQRYALMVEAPPPGGDELDALLDCLAPGALDLVLVEGFKLGPYPKVEVRRAGHTSAPLDVTGIIAVASDEVPPPRGPWPVFALDDVAALAAFIVAHVGKLRDLPAPTSSA